MTQEAGGTCARPTSDDLAMAQKEKEVYVRKNRLCMGTLLEISLYGRETDRCRQALEAAFAEVLRLEDLLSFFKLSSALSRINRLAPYGPVKVNPEVISLIQQALAFSRLTHGALDLTISPLMKLWGFRKQEALLTPPTMEQIQSILRFVGYQKVIVDAENSMVAYQSEGVEIEFGSMGKGYAIDRAVQILKYYGISQALVNFGSSTYALGSPPSKNGWRVAIRNPRNGERAIDTVLLKDCAIGTSGDYEQGRRLNGRWYGHILDPRTGYPVTGTACVSVIARTALEADALSTAAFVMGPESGMRFLENWIDVEGIIVSDEVNAKHEITRTPDWPGVYLKRSSGMLLTRRRFLTVFFAAIGWLMMDPGIGYATVYLTPEEALKRLMPEGSKIMKETITLTPSQKEQVEKLVGSRIREDTYTVWIGDKDGKPGAYAVGLDVIGKERPITFMVAVSPEGKVTGVEVLVYRESRGSEIRSKRFMQQFIDKNIAAPLMLDRDIDSISGATLSSRSTAYAVKKALSLVTVIYGNGGTGSR